MMAKQFFNEWDEKAAGWMQRLADHGHLPEADISTKSIVELRPSDLKGYDQCHFFAGIGGWPLAMKVAGLDDVKGIWTGSAPCQPFSTAGSKKGKEDERHLAPVWLGFIKECKPLVVFGEQVEAAIRFGWLDDLFNELEAQGYSCGASILPACGAGAPHIRKRIFFGGIRLADSDSEGPSGREVLSQRRDQELTRESSLDVGLPLESWGNPEWVDCWDGKRRPFEPGAHPLAYGVPETVGSSCTETEGKKEVISRSAAIHGYGNAIVPSVAAKFMAAFLDAAEDTIDSL